MCVAIECQNIGKINNLKIHASTDDTFWLLLFSC